MDIPEQNAVDWKRQNNIPGSASLNWGRQEKDLTWFQQLILIVMTKKGTDWKRYQRRYYSKPILQNV